MRGLSPNERHQRLLKLAAHLTQEQRDELERQWEAALAAKPQGREDVHQYLSKIAASTTPEQREEFQRQLETTLTAMTPEQAAFVRRVRVDHGHTWAGVAGDYLDAWGGWWTPSGNVRVGMALCETAATYFGEDWRLAPWN